MAQKEQGSPSVDSDVTYLERIITMPHHERDALRAEHPIRIPTTDPRLSLRQVKGVEGQGFGGTEAPCGLADCRPDELEIVGRWCAEWIDG